MTLTSDAIGVLQRDTASSVALSRRGENARLTFLGTAGEAVTLEAEVDATVPASEFVYYTIYTPNGTQLASSNTTTATTMNLASLPDSGEYLVFVDVRYGAEADTRVLLLTGPAASRKSIVATVDIGR